MESKLDDHQFKVISHLPTARLLVMSAPGTGKTHTACRRVAWLIKHEVPAESILVISFTRTAIAEFSARLKTLVSDKHSPEGVQVMTLDSMTWGMLHTHTEKTSKPVLSGKYEDNIVELRNKLAGDSPDILESIAGLGHIIIDEGQDIVGVRAGLVVELLKKIRKSCGVTVFLDPAQGIYGFTNEEKEGGTQAEESLSEKLPTLKPAFSTINLEKIFRTKDKSLIEIAVGETRKIALSRRPRVSDIKASVKRLAAKEEQRPPYAENTLILHRTRLGVLLDAQAAIEREHNHRVRMGSMRARVDPWLGAFFHDLVSERIDKETFVKRWVTLRVTENFPGRNVEVEWAKLIRLAGNDRGRVELSILRNLLARLKPPIEFTLSDLGHGGPIYSTIHASKGREAEDVLLSLAKSWDSKDDEGDECKVWYVGATRARKCLMVRDGDVQPFSQTLGPQRNRRHLILTPSGFHFEVGRFFDFDQMSVGSDLGRNQHTDVRRTQGLLADCGDKLTPARMLLAGRYAQLQIIRDGKDWETVGYLGEMVVNDLRQAVDAHAKKFHKAAGELDLPTTIEGLGVYGASTYAYEDKRFFDSRLKEPLNKTGILLVPIVHGFPEVILTRRKMF